MYHPRVIAAKERALLRDNPEARAIFPDGIPWYSVAESAQITAEITSLRTPKGDLKRPLDEAEQRFLGATRLRINFDFPYFAERFVWIDEEGHGIRPLFPLWESQRYVLQKIGEIEYDHILGKHPDGILLNVLKARQLGVSTEAESISAHRVLTQAHTRALTGADVEEQAGYLFRMVNRLYEQLPWFLQPERLTFVKNREMSFSNASYLKTAWGKSTRGALQSVTGGEGNKGSIGRGQTYSVVHISELATWDNPSQLDSALIPAIPMSPFTLVLFESTAEHAGDWWHHHWLAAKGGDGRFANIFIPWYVEPGKYALPAPASWTPSRLTLQHASKCELTSPQYIGRAVTLSRDQLYWYEKTRGYYTKKGELHKFLKEYPADDAECFRYAGRAIFSTEQLEQIDAAGSKRKLLDVWEVSPARDIAELRRMEEPVAQIHPPDRPVPRKRPHPPLSMKTPASPAIAHEIFPVPEGYGFRRLEGDELHDLPDLKRNVLSIWEYPRARGQRRYVMSVDVGEGLGGDYSVIDIIRCPTIEDPGEQVAQYCSNTIDTQSLAFVCDAIGRLYGDHDQVEAQAAVEINGPGLAVQDVLQLHLGYTNFYIWEYADAASPEKRFSSKIGWVTNTRTRPMLIAAFYSAITSFDPITSQPDLILNSPSTRAELRHFITEGTIGEAEAARGQHDDCVMAGAIGYYVSWRLAGGEFEPISERRSRRTAQRALAAATPTARRDWRNSPATAEEADTQQEDDDEFARDSHTAGAFFDDEFVADRNRIF